MFTIISYARTMHVMTLDWSKFKASCLQLSDQCLAAGYRPACIVGILNGGAYVARDMAASFPSVPVFSVELRRPSTKKKSPALGAVLRHMPRWLLDIMRMAESRILEMKNNSRRLSHTVKLPQDIERFLSSRTDAHILLVDDAVDSGATMASVAESIAIRFPGTHIHTAAITVTTRHPIFIPDQSLFSNRTLIRFPWSIDAK
ncbi:MAG: hypothetical protein K2F63_05110 [Muribaculaceae bacterium]|nr:hypothetical protein [Muribaculaceae bacterium]MDE6134968.1 hypothetical protein [Muribaculaceae bacterium]